VFVCDKYVHNESQPLDMTRGKELGPLVFSNDFNNSQATPNNTIYPVLLITV